VTQRIAVRDDRRVGDGEQLLVRMNDDRDIANALKLSLANAPAYRAVPGFERSGALTVSCFAVADEIEAQIVVRGTRWSWYGLARASSLGDRFTAVLRAFDPRRTTGDQAGRVS